ncbi:MAG: LapA family protein [Gammaproteobacteria bacterium]|nr:LapA family protein [Gammaproteobacteria bacterium]
MKTILYLVVLLIVAGFAVTFAYKNPGDVAISYYGFHGEWRLVVVLLVTFIAGALFGLLLTVISNLKVRRQLSQAKREVKKSTQELSAVKSLSAE